MDGFLPSSNPRVYPPFITSLTPELTRRDGGGDADDRIRSGTLHGWSEPWNSVLVAHNTSFDVGFTYAIAVRASSLPWPQVRVKSRLRSPGSPRPTARAQPQTGHGRFYFGTATVPEHRTLGTLARQLRSFLASSTAGARAADVEDTHRLTDQAPARRRRRLTSWLTCPLPRCLSLHRHRRRHSLRGIGLCRCARAWAATKGEESGEGSTHGVPGHGGALRPRRFSRRPDPELRDIKALCAALQLRVEAPGIPALGHRRGRPPPRRFVRHA